MNPTEKTSARPRVTRESIIAANPEFDWRDVKIHGRAGLAFTGHDGQETWTIWNDYGHVTAPAAHLRNFFGYRVAVANLTCVTPGNEFNTAADDTTASIFRRAGFLVERTKDGLPRIGGLAA